MISGDARLIVHVRFSGEEFGPGAFDAVGRKHMVKFLNETVIPSLIDGWGSSLEDDHQFDFSTLSLGKRENE